MIQSAQIKPIDAKALKGAEGKVQESGLVDIESLLEGADFSNELEAIMGEEEPEAGEALKLAIGQSSNQMTDQMLVDPTLLLEGIPKEGLPKAGHPEILGPKVFDPALTQGVEKLVQPMTTQTPVELTNEQILKLAKGDVAEVKAEVAQTLLKSSQLNQAGRSPAIELTQSEIDPQLINMEDFVLQKNLMNKKNLPVQGYGMKQEAQKELMGDGLKSTEIVTDISGKEGAASNSTSSQQFILNMMSEQSDSPKVNEAQVTKVFDMSQVKSGDSNQIMTQITDYIAQAKAAKEPTVNMRMNHDQLGMIDITVSKTGTVNQEAVAINIGAHSQDGKSFFQQNSKELLTHMSTAGITVSDFKVETPSQLAKNDFDMNHQGRGQGGQGEKQFGSEQNQRRHESDRRQELWDLLKDKEAA